jgi:formylglycine-generating enzyme required for sulfatase activity
MGSADSEKDRGDNEGPQHQVMISKPFYMGVYEITQAIRDQAMTFVP